MTLFDVSTIAGVAAIVSGLVAALSPLIASVPGLRAGDAMRSTLMRVLVYVLNLATLVGLAWTQNVVITQQMVPALLLAVGGSTVGSHLFYVNVKSATTTAPAASSTTTPPAPSTATPALQEAPGSSL